MQSIEREEGYPLALFATYMAMIRGSVGSNQYRRLYVRTSKTTIDVIGEGDLACAFYASSILTLCGLTREGVHTTVIETISDLALSGWYKIDEPRVGCVIIWGEKPCSDGKRHRHIGFYGGNGRAISNVGQFGRPIDHGIEMTFGLNQPPRPIEALYFHPKLEEV